LRMADAPLVPLEFSSFADAIATYVEQLRKLTDDKRQDGGELAKLLEQNAFGLAADPTRVVRAPERERPVTAVDFAALAAASARLKASARAYDEGYARLMRATAPLPDGARRQLNALLQGMEQKLTDAQGLPGRDWFKHFVYAPGRLTGYGVKTLPAVREAIDAGEWEEANRYAAFTATVLGRYCDQLDQLTALLPRT
jgi:N-acetylated-alpha-linked acidic dipeptidase